MSIKCLMLIALLTCAFLCSCNKRTEGRIQEEVARIAAERERLAELQQEQREKVAADLSSRADTREARRAANLEQAAAEQARRDGIVAELKAFIDDLLIENTKINTKEILRMNGRPVSVGSVLATPAGYSVKFAKTDADFWYFNYDEDAFSVTLKKDVGGFTAVQIQSKQPLAPGFQVDQTLPDFSSGLTNAHIATSFPRLTVLAATYGAGSTQRDVKDLVKGKIQNGRLNFRAHSGELGGDPIFGQVKTFYIKYISSGRVQERSFREGEQVSLP